ncbi:ZIP family metal transporter [Flavobacteriales bacterium]|jgi:hypothetical protein|nr:ZIP family metal transporter [Flavobacteriales bacterium]MDG2085798.1 ZIP family metal transporter [Flavobacteriales bacterium]
MNYVSIILLFASVIIGAALVEIIKVKKNNKIQLLLTFSGAYLLSVSVLHLLPVIFTYDSHRYIGIYVLFGFLIQIILEHFSKGIEHGHGHFRNRQIIPFSVVISLCLHAFLEGIPLAGQLHNHAHNALLTGVVLHKLPVAIVLMTLFVQSNIGKKRSYALLLIFAAMSPLGVLTGELFTTLVNYQNEIMAIVIGVFLHISTTILFESSTDHKFSLQKILIIITAILISIFSV